MNLIVGCYNGAQENWKKKQESSSVQPALQRKNGNSGGALWWPKQRREEGGGFICVEAGEGSRTGIDAGTSGAAWWEQAAANDTHRWDAPWRIAGASRD
jgi:hypothetical protein